MPEPDISGLQTAIDSFSRTVTKLQATAEKLTTLADSMGKAPADISVQSTNNKPSGGFTQFAKSMFSAATSQQQKPGSNTRTSPFSDQRPNGSGTSFGGRRGFLAGMASRGGTAGMVAGNAPSPGMAAAGFGASALGAVKNSSLSPVQTAGTIAGAGVSALASFGAASLPTQVDISSYTRSQALFGMSNQTSRNLSYGSNGNNLNMLGQNAQDAGAGQATINSLGNYDPTSARFQTANAGAAGVGMANPGSSYAQDANFMAIMTDPTMSRQLNMSGIQDTMTQRGGKTASLATEQSAIMKRLTGKTSMSQTDFNQQIGGINTSGNKWMQQQFGADIAAQLTASLSLQNRLMQGMDASGKSGVNKKLNEQQTTTLLQNASKGKQGALDTLKKYGAPESDIQALQKKNSVATATQGDISQDFTSGLIAITNTLGGLDKFLEKILNIPGIKQVAEVAGFLGTAESFLGFSGGGLVEKNGWVTGWAKHESPNKGSGMKVPGVQGVIFHTMVGQLASTDSEFMNASQQLSAHFGIDQSGNAIQWVDIRGGVAWAEAAGNETWYSVEMADNGNPDNPYTAAQIQTAGQLAALLSNVGGFPLQIANSTGGQGLGTHNMGGAAWGGHSCPDLPPQHVRSNQREAIIAKAQQIKGGKGGTSSSSSSTKQKKRKQQSSASGSGGGGASAPSGIMEAANVAAGLAGGSGGGGGGGSSASSSSSSSASSGGGSASANSGDALSVAKALMSADGFNKAAAAGMVGVFQGESGNSPESVGSGGNGLIGWTPPLAGAVTGNAAKDMAFQIKAIKTYTEANGSVSDMNSFSDPVAAGKHWSIKYERPKVQLSDYNSTNQGISKTVFSKLARGTTQAALGTPRTPAHTSSGNTVNVDIANGSIVNDSDSKSVAARSSREFIVKIEKLLKDEDLYTAIAKGDH